MRELAFLLIGGLVTFIVTRVLKWWEKTDNRSYRANLIIYHLFELYHLSKTVDYDFFHDQLSQVSQNQNPLPDKYKPYFPVIIEQMIPAVFDYILSVQRPKIDKHINELKKAITEYSKEAPIEAFELNTEHNILFINDMFDNLTTTIVKKADPDDQAIAKQVATNVNKPTHKEITDDILKSIEGNILLMAKRISGKMTKKCELKLANIKKDKSLMLDEDIKEYFAKIDIKKIEKEIEGVRSSRPLFRKKYLQG